MDPESEKNFVEIKGVVSDAICRAINNSRNGKIRAEQLNEFANEATDKIMKSMEKMKAELYKKEAAGRE
jgi:hypothetical protein